MSFEFHVTDDIPVWNRYNIQLSIATFELEYQCVHTKSLHVASGTLSHTQSPVLNTKGILWANGTGRQPITVKPLTKHWQRHVQIGIIVTQWYPVRDLIIWRQPSNGIHMRALSHTVRSKLSQSRKRYMQNHRLQIHATTRIRMRSAVQFDMVIKTREKLNTRHTPIQLNNRFEYVRDPSRVSPPVKIQRCTYVVDNMSSRDPDYTLEYVRLFLVFLDSAIRSLSEYLLLENFVPPLTEHLPNKIWLSMHCNQTGSKWVKSAPNVINHHSHNHVF